MNELSPAGTVSIDRRSFLAGLVSVGSTTVAGCGDSRNAGQPEESPAVEPRNPAGMGNDIPEQIQLARREIETVFDGLSDLPIFKNNEFVFDVNYFENEFDHLDVKRTAERAIERLEQSTTHDVSESKIEELARLAEIGKLLVAQRVMIHQLIAAGLTLERLIFRKDYEQGLEVTQYAPHFLENLRLTGEKIESRISKNHGSEFSIDGYHPTAIWHTQENLVELMHWSDYVYEAFHHAVLALKKYDEGNVAIESAQYTVAESSYSKSEQQFKAAAKSFDEAQGTGRQIPHIVHLVDGLRCLIPAYLASSGPLQSSMEQFDDGNEEQAEEIAREAIKSANERATRCL